MHETVDTIHDFQWNYGKVVIGIGATFPWILRGGDAVVYGNIFTIQGNNTSIGGETAFRAVLGSFKQL